jgi:hypothetical protein
MSTHQQDPIANNEVPRPEWGLISGQKPDQEKNFRSTAIPFRLIADFVVETETAVEFLQRDDLAPQERDLFLIVLTTPEARNRMCRLAIVSDFEAHLADCYFDDKFRGPQPADILNCISPYLPEALLGWWKEFQQENSEYFSYRIGLIFMEFRTALRRIVIQDMTTQDAIPMRAGQI